MTEKRKRNSHEVKIYHSPDTLPLTHMFGGKCDTSVELLRKSSVPALLMRASLGAGVLRTDESAGAGVLRTDESTGSTDLFAGDV